MGTCLVAHASLSQGESAYGNKIKLTHVKFAASCRQSTSAKIGPMNRLMELLGLWGVGAQERTRSR